MSMSLSFVGSFKNGKTRTIGSFVKTNGLNNSKLYMDMEDTMFIVRMLESDNKCFNWCLQENRFKEVKVYCWYEGKEILAENISLPLRRIDKQIVINYVEKANAEVKKQIKFKYDKSFNDLTVEEKEKVFCKWTMMQAINKTVEEKTKEFNSLISENSRVDKHYNIIFNA